MFRNAVIDAYRIGIVIAVVSIASKSAHAAIVINLQEIGSDVVATGSGTANLTELGSPVSSTGGVFIDPSAAGILLGSTGASNLYLSITTPGNFGSGMPLAPNSTTGFRWGVAGNALLVPTGYSTGDMLFSTSTWNNTTLAGLGVTPGIYTWTWGSGANADSVTMNAISASAVPEPSSLTFVGIACLGFAARIRRKNLRTVTTR